MVPYAEKRCLLAQSVRRADSSWRHYAGSEMSHADDASQKMDHDDDHHQPSHNQTWQYLPVLKASMG
ncbi:hypothetical protein WKH53_12395 [Pantoea agglomerans]|uniref:hypothetical protein n=1 Tax=Enterobacter agglomerans TaxID=549 RepID=UPI0013D84900|nr:hypothetical protein [Pantoea agglomerans]NEG66354.1 hypothetical protein [Pantoea agglomerans]